MGDDGRLAVTVPLDEYEVMVAALAALADIRRGDKIVVDKAKFEQLLKVAEQVDRLIGKPDDAAGAREKAEAPTRRPVPPGMIM